MKIYLIFKTNLSMENHSIKGLILFVHKMIDRVSKTAVWQGMKIAYLYEV